VKTIEMRAHNSEKDENIIKKNKKKITKIPFEITACFHKINLSKNISYI